MAIRTDGALFAWGAGNNGVIGNSSTTNRSSPVLIGSSSWTAVAVGNTHALAIRTDGALFAWGLNSSGQLGNGLTTSVSSPIQIGSSSWTAVSTSNNSSFAIRQDSLLFSWGLGSYGILGDGTAVSKSSPVLIGTSSWTALQSNGQTTAGAKLLDGTFWMWGRNHISQMNQFNSTSTFSSPVQVGMIVGPQIPSWTTIVNGGLIGNTDSWTAGIANNGRLYYWGVWSLAPLNTFNVSSPVQIGSSSWTAVSVSTNDVAYALRSDGALFAWGTGSGGMLGQGDTLNRKSPTQIGTSSWSALGTGTMGDHVTAIRSDGALFAWGQNTFGQLGDGTTTNRSSPVQIGTSSWTVTSAGGFYTLTVTCFRGEERPMEYWAEILL
jgi:alpha-tubulin suppressor-like RCC1 family protein